MKPHTGGSVSALCNSAYAMSEKMDELIAETAKTGTERGISWCAGKSGSPSDEIISFNKPYETNCVGDAHSIGEKCIGDKQCVYIKRPTICPGDSALADFHTHPSATDDEFSSQDYKTSFNAGMSLDCLGTSKNGKKTIICDAIIQNKNYERHRSKIIDVFDTRCKARNTEYTDAVERGEPKEVLVQKYDEYLVGRNAMLSAIRDAIDDGVIKRCSVSSNISESSPPPLPDIPDRMIKIERRYDTYDSSCLDYVDKSTNEKIGFISYSVWDEWKEDKDGKDYIEKEGKIHDVEFDMEYPAEDILYNSIEKVLCDLKCKGAEKRVYIDDTQYAEIFEDILEFERSSKDSRTIEKDISDIECKCVTGAESVTGIV